MGKQLVGKLITAFLIALLMLGTGLLGQVAWRSLMRAAVLQVDVPESVTDALSQREIQLQGQAQLLAETLLASNDLRVSVVIDDDGLSRARQIALLINRHEADASLALALREILWSGLALRESRGDRIVVQFRAFKAAPGSIELIAHAFTTWRAMAGLAMVILAVFGFWLKKQWQGRAW